MTKHYDVVIATPGRMMHAEYVESLVKTCSWLSSQGISYTLSSQYSSFVPTAREWTAVAHSGHDWTANSFGGDRLSCDVVFWIDSDVSWKVEDFQKLLESELEVVSGMVPVSRDGRIGATRIVDGNFTVLSWTDFIFDEDPVEVDGIGLAFVAMKSGVFEKMSRPWFKIRSGKVSGFDGEVNVGEDYSFCMNMTDVGIKIFVDPKVRVGHHKSITLELN
jgi:hypothetical protein